MFILKRQQRKRSLIKVVFCVKPSRIHRELSEHGRYSFDLFIREVLSISLSRNERRRFVDLRLVKEVKKHVLRLVIVVSVVFVVDNHRRNLKVKRCNKGEIVPLDESDLIMKAKGNGLTC